jgi:hypothetical protein
MIVCIAKEDSLVKNMVASLQEIRNGDFKQNIVIRKL